MITCLHKTQNQITTGDIEAKKTCEIRKMLLVYSFTWLLDSHNKRTKVCELMDCGHHVKEMWPYKSGPSTKYGVLFIYLFTIY